jgi:hypothetical protein
MYALFVLQQWRSSVGSAPRHLLTPMMLCWSAWRLRWLLRSTRGGLRIRQALRLRRLDRVTQHLGWHLLYVALRCGAATVTWCRAAGLHELRDALCFSAVQCVGDGLGDGQLKSLPRVFLHCPVVQPVFAWLQALWGQMVEGRVPPVDAQVLLAGDRTVWDPGGGEAGAELWAHLRHSAVLPCDHALALLPGQVYSAGTVVALVTSWVQRAIRLDWPRITSDLAGASASLPTYLVQYSHTL